MAVKPNTDAYYRSQTTESDIVNKLYTDPNYDYSEVPLVDATQYNRAIRINYSDLYPLRDLETLTENPDEWIAERANTWLMPNEYKNFEIEKFIRDCATTEVERQRIDMELQLYAEKNLINLLRYLKYLIDVMRANNIVWGVGRGSSVSSYVLYVLGVHRVNSIEYNLNITEFLR